MGDDEIEPQLSSLGTGIETSPASTSREPLGYDRAEATSGLVPYVTITYCPDPTLVGTTLQLTAKPLAIGRAVADGFSIRDRRLSRVHCRLGFDRIRGEFTVEDAGSTNGVHVNGERATAGRASDSAVVRAGSCVFVCMTRDPMQGLKRSVLRVAETELTALILGETGTGKERLARSIHHHSGRAGEFVAVNCASLTRELAEAELFGHSKGAFSGADKARKGLFATADGGTLFLDEIGDTPPSVQVALLRALQERRIRPVGEDKEIPVDVRIVAATHADLMTRITKQEFRADLYARLAQFTLRVPPLRERKTELLSLFREFYGRRALHEIISPSAAEALLLWGWPFNVRELESMVRSFKMLRGETARLDLEYLNEAHPEVSRKAGAASAVPHTGPEIVVPQRHNRQSLEALLKQHAGNISALANELRTSRSQVYRLLKAANLDAEQFRN